MNKFTLVLLCCSAFLYACDSSNDAGKAVGADKGKEIKSPVVESDSSAVVVSGGTDNVKQGEAIYKSKCSACHNTGAAGAPKLGDNAAWNARIAQGGVVLAQHAIEGYKGETGYMPPKGGFLSLSDEEISITVQYMVSQSQ